MRDGSELPNLALDNCIFDNRNPQLPNEGLLVYGGMAMALFTQICLNKTRISTPGGTASNLINWIRKWRKQARLLQPQEAALCRVGHCAATCLLGHPQNSRTEAESAEPTLQFSRPRAIRFLSLPDPWDELTRDKKDRQSLLTAKQATLKSLVQGGKKCQAEMQIMVHQVFFLSFTKMGTYSKSQSPDN